ncbi:MAG: 4Fe-4S dicluster domain-containing protein [Chloroflexi bacterium]|nr:4Fe-4S dicluster domain-containing protein [Chloroflexota bacterium]
MGSQGQAPESLQGENQRKWQLSRRRLLKLAGAAGATAVAAQLGAGLLREARGAEEEAQATPKRLRRWGMIIDLRRCDGCQSQGTPPKCTAACIEGHFAPEPMEWIEVYEHELPGGGTQFLPTPCMQCQNPPCVNVCPVGATWSTPEGHVLIDQNRCIGCRMCMAACPYERRFFTWGQPTVPLQSLFLEYSPEHQVPAKKGVVYKCDFCPEMARAGRLPFCAQACPQHAIYYGDLEADLATNGEAVVRFSQFISQENAFRYKDDLGTNPRVYYIPGHGEATGRSPDKKGKLPTRWTWEEKVKGGKTWKRQ